MITLTVVCVSTDDSDVSKVVCGDTDNGKGQQQSCLIFVVFEFPKASKVHRTKTPSRIMFRCDTPLKPFYPILQILRGSATFA